VLKSTVPCKRCVNYNTGKQYKNIVDTIQAHDKKDTYIVLNHLLEKEPFSPDTSVRSISTGVYVHITVNVDKEQRPSIGNTNLARMDGHTTSEYSFKKKDNAITLNIQSSVKIGDEAVHVRMILNFFSSHSQFLQKHHEIWHHRSSI